MQSQSWGQVLPFALELSPLLLEGISKISSEQNQHAAQMHKA
jgi:hypothetical protein